MMSSGLNDGRRRLVTCLMAAALLIVTTGGPAASQPMDGTVRVKVAHANVHMGASTAQQVLWMAPQDTVLTAVERRGLWIAVRLTPQMRQRGTVLRWYENEDQGWIHESLLEIE